MNKYEYILKHIYLFACICLLAFASTPLKLLSAHLPDVPLDELEVITPQNAQESKELAVYEGNIYPINSIDVSPDDNLLAIGSTDGNIYIWSMTDRDTRELIGHEDPITDVEFSPDGRFLASSSADRTVRIWELETRLEIQNIEVESIDWVNSVSFSPDEQFVAYTSGGNLWIWNVNGLSPRVISDECCSGIYDAIFSPDGSYLLYASGYGDYGGIPSITVLEFSTGEVIHTFEGHDWSISSLVIDSGSKLLITSSLDQTIRFWDLTTELEVLSLSDLERTPTSLALNMDDSLVAVGNSDGSLKVIQVSDGQLLLELIGHSDEIKDVEFNAAGTLIASGSADGTVRLWGIDSGTDG